MSTSLLAAAAVRHKTPIACSAIVSIVGAVGKLNNYGAIRTGPGSSGLGRGTPFNSQRTKEKMHKEGVAAGAKLYKNQHLKLYYMRVW